MSNEENKLNIYEFNNAGNKIKKFIFKYFRFGRMILLFLFVLSIFTLYHLIVGLPERDIDLNIVQPPNKNLTPGTSWQWQLQDTIDETILDNVDNPKKMYDIDLFNTDAATISRLKAKGIIVICYFSAGSSEDFRPDYGNFPESVKGKSNSWVGEKWLDIRQINILRPIMSERFDMAVSKGCDGVEPDNVDGYINDTGFPLSANDQLNYNKFLAQVAHERNLSIGLKNDIDQVSQLEPYFDWALNEQCYQHNECEGYSVFVDGGKAVFGVEYQGDIDDFCPKANAANYDWLKKDLELGATPRTTCR